jgi:biotin operon repressor
MMPREDGASVMLKALADDTRLGLMRLLNGREYTVGELARQLARTEPTISHHLTKLREAGFVTLRMVGTQHYYSINASGLAHFKKLAQTIEVETPQPVVEERDDAWIYALDWSDEDKTVLLEYTLNKRLQKQPKMGKKWLVILRWLASLFEVGRQYTEPEVNAILKAVHEDYARLRRDLISFGHMARENSGKSYWRTPENAA